MRKILTDAADIGNAAGGTLNWRPKESLGWSYYLGRLQPITDVDKSTVESIARDEGQGDRPDLELKRSLNARFEEQKSQFHVVKSAVGTSTTCPISPHSSAFGSFADSRAKVGLGRRRDAVAAAHGRTVAVSGVDARAGLLAARRVGHNAGAAFVAIDGGSSSTQSPGNALAGV